MIDYSAYGKRFVVMSKILRGYGKCALCGAENHKAHPNTGSEVVLTVHHLDEDIKNNDLFNLAPLCQKCHLGAHREDAEKLKYRELSHDYLKWNGTLLEFIGYVRSKP